MCVLSFFQSSSASFPVMTSGTNIFCFEVLLSYTIVITNDFDPPFIEDGANVKVESSNLGSNFTTTSVAPVQSLM